MQFQLTYFKYMMLLLKCCTHYASKFGKSAEVTGLETVSFHSNPKERDYQRTGNTYFGDTKESSSYCTIALTPHASKVMLKILQARQQQYMHWELPEFKLILEKAEEPEINC